MLPANENPIRRVLVIAYYFPPMGLSGVQRTLKFVKYLPQFGWLPTVLTVEPRGYVARDDGLLQDLKGCPVAIVRTRAAGPGRLFEKRETVGLPRERTRKTLSRISDAVFFPDNKIGWKSRGVATGLALHEETRFDLIFATAPPFTDFLIGAELKRHLNLPLVFDYRDPWLEYPFKWYPTRFHKRHHMRLEREALRASSHVVTTNRRVKELILRRHKFLTYHDIDIIPQGFDPADFPPSRSRPPRSAGVVKRRRMRVSYAGVFWEDRVPDHFLRALQELFARKPKLRGRIEAVFIGTFRDENRNLVAELGLQDSVTILGYLPHDQCVKELIDSDLLWMIVGDDVGSPGKVYEYIGARKPILGCAPDGFIKSTILEAGGTVVAPSDVSGIRDALEHYFDLFERNKLTGPPEDVVKRFDRVALTQQLVKTFESLLVP